MNARHLVILAVAITGATALAGCSSARDVEVSGDVSSRVALKGSLNLEFFDVSGTGADAARTSVQSITLDAPGAFKQSVPLEGDHVLVRAIDDRDGDGACTAGEPWAEVEVTIKDDNTVDPIALDLALQPCPGGG